MGGLRTELKENPVVLSVTQDSSFWSAWWLMFFLLSPAPLSPSCLFCTCSCLLSFAPSPFMPAVGLSPPPLHSGSLEPDNGPLFWVKNPCSVSHPLKPSFRPRVVWVRGRSNWLAGRGMALAVEPTGARYISMAHDNHLSSYLLLCVSSSLRATQVQSFMHLPCSCLILAVHICILLSLSFFFAFFSKPFPFFLFLYIYLETGAHCVSVVAWSLLCR